MDIHTNINTDRPTFSKFLSLIRQIESEIQIQTYKYKNRDTKAGDTKSGHIKPNIQNWTYKIELTKTDIQNQTYKNWTYKIGYTKPEIQKLDI